MELNINDRVIERPEVADIEQAVDAAPKPRDWFLTLDADNGSSLDVTLKENGAYRLIRAERQRRFTAAGDLTDAQLKAILIAYLGGDKKWRRLCSWNSDDLSPATPAAKRASAEPPQWAIILVVASIGLTVLFFNLPGSWLSMLPFSDSDYLPIFMIFAPMLVMVLAMIANKIMETRKAADWPASPGRIIKSGMGSRTRQFQGEAATIINEPVVDYEFAANGRNWRGSRISIGEDSGGANSAATLARYPVGATVTVYYDPKNPKNCVLERKAPEGLGEGCLVLLSIAVIIGCGIWWAVYYGEVFIETHLPKAQTGAMIFASCFGLVLLLAFFGSRKLSKRAAGWPSARGTVLRSTTESFERWDDGRRSTTYAPVVEYLYRVNGLEYRSRQIKLGLKVEGSLASAQAVAARYPQGSTVEVHYDPANTGNAALENPTGIAWLLLGISLFCFGVAAYTSGYWR